MELWTPWAAGLAKQAHMIYEWDPGKEPQISEYKSRSYWLISILPIF